MAPGVRSQFGLPASRSDARFRRSGTLFNAVRHIAGGSELAIGAEYPREHGTSATVYELFGRPVPADFDLLRRTGSAFAELKWLVASDFIVRAGLRRDSVQGKGPHWSPSVGARYSLPRLDGYIKASYSEGFKPPSFFALACRRCWEETPISRLREAGADRSDTSSAWALHPSPRRSSGGATATW